MSYSSFFAVEHAPTKYHNSFIIKLDFIFHFKNNRHTKKTWIPTVVVPRVEAVALPISLEQQREAHAEYKIYSSAT